MKVFKVWVDKVPWDRTEGFIIVAESEEVVRKGFHVDEWGQYSYRSNGYSVDFGDDQTPEGMNSIHIEELDGTKSGIACTF